MGFGKKIRAERASERTERKEKSPQLQEKELQVQGSALSLGDSFNIQKSGKRARMGCEKKRDVGDPNGKMTCSHPVNPCGFPGGLGIKESPGKDWMKSGLKQLLPTGSMALEKLDSLWDLHPNYPGVSRKNGALDIQPKLLQVYFPGRCFGSTFWLPVPEVFNPFGFSKVSQWSCDSLREFSSWNSPRSTGKTVFLGLKSLEIPWKLSIHPSFPWPTG